MESACWVLHCHFGPVWKNDEKKLLKKFGFRRWHFFKNTCIFGASHQINLLVLLVFVRTLVALGLWNFKVGSQKIVRFWLKDHHAQRKFLYLVNRHNTHTQDTIQDTLYKKLFWSCLSLRQNLTDFWLPNLIFHNQTDAFTYMYICNIYLG